MKYQIKHVTQYVYNYAVSQCDNKALIAPRDTPTQRLLDYSIQIDPAPSSSTELKDYFGNTVLSFNVREPHTQMTVTAESTVECYPRLTPPAMRTPAWETSVEMLRSQYDRDCFEAYEYTFASRYIPIHSEFHDYAISSFCAGRPVLDGVLDLTRRIHADFSYEPHSTDIATPLFDVVEQRRGVCQDFAHFQIACLRSLGMAAKYISGYLRTIPPPGRPRLEGSDASHAWVSVFVPGAGWIDVDPTNNAVVSTDHIVLGWGRDFDEVSPIKGIILGGGKQIINVAVDVIPLDQPITQQTQSQQQNQQDQKL